MPDGRLCPQVLQTYDGEGTLQSSFLYGKERIADVKEANTNYFMLDELGSVMALTDEKGNVVSHYDYDEFGVPAPFDNLNKGGNRLSNIFGYTGEEYDEELGLLNLRARNYDAEIGQFIQRDPYDGHTNDPATFHKYMYVYNNPLKFVDPLGTSLVMGDGGVPAYGPPAPTETFGGGSTGGTGAGGSWGEPDFGGGSTGGTGAGDTWEPAECKPIDLFPVEKVVTPEFEEMINRLSREAVTHPITTQGFVMIIGGGGVICIAALSPLPIEDIPLVVIGLGSIFIGVGVVVVGLAVDPYIAPYLEELFY